MYYVFKDLPILSLHPQAGLAAQAAECAGQQGEFWAMHDKLFADPREWDNTTTETAIAAFGRYADAIGLDGAALQQCVISNETLAEVEGDLNEAQRLGITGTPAFVINNKLLSGAQPTEIFVQILESELRAQ